MARSFILQDFSQPAQQHSADEDRTREAYERGYATGAREAAEASARAHAEAQDQLRAELIEAVQDLAMARDEAQAQVVRGIAPLVRSLVTHLVPRLAARGLAEEAEQLIDAELAARPKASACLVCAPDTAEPLHQSLSQLPRCPEIRIDPVLTPFELRIEWGDGFDHVDFGPLYRHLDESLAALCEPQEKEPLAHAG